tara:strand:- start:492 stop:902 length:411 start_codon:yes stop_codon:yes gene_type:complete
MARIVPKIYPNDLRENDPIGIGFPLTVGSQKQNFLTSEQVHDNLRNLILTMKGERPMNPNFGCDVYYLLFEPIDVEELREAATEAILDAVNTWMPAVQIKQIDIDPRPDNNLVVLEIFYSVNGWNAENVLNLEVNV